ncbi:hypothetical protein AnigIFM60653_002112 [Aspergillus niger]|nr:hypothetical protein AnigIFM50267_002617 [Aspergillus niger]GLA10235.1 hypothetical protein AnigIFM60653_002112 [Aspergillus niger]
MGLLTKTQTRPWVGFLAGTHGLGRALASSRLTDQWPCERPQLPDISRLDRKNASEACALLCTQWYQNRTFLRSLREVQARLTARVPRCSNNDTTPELDSLISEFCGNPDPYRRELGEGLRDRLEALEAREWPCSPTSLSVPRDVLERHCHVLTRQRDDLWDRLHEMLIVAGGSADRVSSALLWPHISVLSILSPLVADQWRHVPDSWKTTLLAFAQSVTSLRRSKRLLACYDRSDIDGFYKEAETAGSEGWDAARSPEWLLLEIENNITIRVHQAEVAQRMICPDQPGNAVSQLNMGEGKTTVITLMVALNLGYASGQEDAKESEKDVRAVSEVSKTINLEIWLRDNCRNLIDESDEVLDPKFQLVYAIGSQQSLDGHSDLWQIVQSLLSLVEQQATKLHN